MDGLLKAARVRVLKAILKRTHTNPDPFYPSHHQLSRRSDHLHSRRHPLYPSTSAFAAVAYFAGGRGSCRAPGYSQYPKVPKPYMVFSL